MRHYLLLEDTSVLSFDFDTGEFNVIRKDLVPYSLRIYNGDYTVNSNFIHLSRLQDFLSSRLLPLQRTNSKLLYTICELPQNNSVITRSRKALELHSVNVNDDYWTRSEDETLSWCDVKLTDKELPTLFSASVKGLPPVAVFKSAHPDFTTDGLFAKAWIKRGNALRLYKTDKTSDKVNCKCEVMASAILDCFIGIEHVKYWLESWDGTTCVVCDLIQRPKSVSMLHCSELLHYCKNNNLTYKEFLLEKFGTDFANMCVLDYIIHNTDRHCDNYAFYMDNDTGEILRLAPLYDHNQALVSSLMDSVNKDILTPTLNDSTTMKELLMEMLPLSNLKLDTYKFSKLKLPNKVHDYLTSVLISLNYLPTEYYGETFNEYADKLNILLEDRVAEYERLVRLCGSSDKNTLDTFIRELMD